MSTMRLPRTPHTNVEGPGLSGSLGRRQNDDDSTIVDVSGYSVASILIITFFVIACLTTLLVTAYCVLSRRYDARAAAAASRYWPRSRLNPAPEEGKPSTNRSEKNIIGERRSGRKKGKRSPTVVFHQHEPQAHGYFAPLYFEGLERPGGPPLGDVKREVSRAYEPEMLERALTREKGEKDDSGGDWKKTRG